MAKPTLFSGLRPLFGKPAVVAPAPATQAPESMAAPAPGKPSKPKREAPAKVSKEVNYSLARGDDLTYPVYEDSSFYRSNDGRWSGTVACQVLSDEHVEADPKFEVVDVLALVQSTAVAAVAWKKVGQPLAHSFTSKTSGERQFRPVVCFKHNDSIMIVDAAFGPPPPTLWGGSEMTPESVKTTTPSYIDSPRADKARLMLAPMNPPPQKETIKEPLSVVFGFIREERYTEASVVAAVVACLNDEESPTHEELVPLIQTGDIHDGRISAARKQLLERVLLEGEAKSILAEIFKSRL